MEPPVVRMFIWTTTDDRGYPTVHMAPTLPPGITVEMCHIVHGSDIIITRPYGVRCSVKREDGIYVLRAH